MSKPIIDISRHQTVTDWKAVAAAVEGIFIKATEGQGYVDPKFAKNAQAAQQLGIAKGFYHFASLNNTDNPAGDARAEAADFFNATKPYSVQLPYVLDLETNKSHLTPAQVVEWVEAFFGKLAELGITDVVLYSYTPFLDGNLPANHRLGKYRLWEAAYVNKPKPVLPKGWTTYWLWQYSSKGSIPGIKGNVDLNRWP